MHAIEQMIDDGQLGAISSGVHVSSQSNPPTLPSQHTSNPGQTNTFQGHVKNASNPYAGHEFGPMMTPTRNAYDPFTPFSRAIDRQQSFHDDPFTSPRFNLEAAEWHKQATMHHTKRWTEEEQRRNQAFAIQRQAAETELYNKRNNAWAKNPVHKSMTVAAASAQTPKNAPRTVLHDPYAAQTGSSSTSPSVVRQSAFLAQPKPRYSRAITGVQQLQDSYYAPSENGTPMTSRSTSAFPHNEEHHYQTVHGLASDTAGSEAGHTTFARASRMATPFPNAQHHQYNEHSLRNGNEVPAEAVKAPLSDVSSSAKKALSSLRAPLGLSDQKHAQPMPVANQQAAPGNIKAQPDPIAPFGYIKQSVQQPWSTASDPKVDVTSYFDLSKSAEELRDPYHTLNTCKPHLYPKNAINAPLEDFDNVWYSGVANVINQMELGRTRAAEGGITTSDNTHIAALMLGPIMANLSYYRMDAAQATQAKKAAETAAVSCWDKAGFPANSRSNFFAKQYGSVKV